MTSKLNLSPHKAKPVNSSTEAWWYENAKSISVYIVVGGKTACCEIPRHTLAQWLKKVAP